MKSQTKFAQILIVDDHPMVREGLALRISAEPDLEVCGEAATEEEALMNIERMLPDLVIVDMLLKNSNGIELIKQIKARFSSVKMLVFSGFHESLYAERALRAGALGYLNKQESDEKVLEAIRSVLRGERFISNEIKEKLIHHALGAKDPTKTAVELLTDRELQVFQMIGDGLSSSAIASQLFLSTHTIDTHRENIKRKMNLKNSAELVRTAVQWVLETS